MRLKRALWRWHFYAGLICAPFFVLLAVTGGIYLFDDEIDRYLLRDIINVSPDGDPADISQIMEVVSTTYPDRSIAQVLSPERTDLAWQIQLSGTDAALTVFVDPFTAEITGNRVGDGPMPFISDLHSLIIAGPIANAVIEAVAGWVVVLFVSGVFVWWPRKKRKPQSTLDNKSIFRRVHVYTGLIAGSILVFLALTGLTWSGVWGAALSDFAAENNLGMPAEVWEQRPESHGHHASGPWALENTGRPQSLSSAPEPIGIAEAVRIAMNQEMPAGFRVESPWSDEGVYTAMALPADAAAQRVLHIDQFSGEVLMDIGFDDYGWIAKTVEYGISLHTGHQFGLINQLIMLLACFGLVVLSISSVLLAWKRRGRSLTPPAAEPKAMVVVSTALVIVLFLFPLTALSAVIIGIIDLLGTMKWGQ